MYVAYWSLGFLSTLPARGATPEPVQPLELQGISIHAPREGSDPFNVVKSQLLG